MMHIFVTLSKTKALSQFRIFGDKKRERMNQLYKVSFLFVVSFVLLLWLVPGSMAETTGTKSKNKRQTLVIHGTGDINLDGRFTKVIQKYGYGYVWHGLGDLFRNDDLTVVNLECSITTRGTREKKSFTFRAPPESLKSVKAAGVEVANIGNNHSRDYGVVGLLDTRKYLLKYGIQPVGAGKDLAEAAKFTLFRIKGWRVAVVGFGGVVPDPYWLAGPHHPGMASGDDIPTMVNAVKAAKKHADLVVVAIHWGIELHRRPPKEDVVRAKAMIDAGADIIFGHHAHRLQALEYYKGRPIFWCLGNFIWPRRLTPGGRTAVAQVIVTPNKKFKARMIRSFLVSSARPALYGKRRRLSRRYRRRPPVSWSPTILSTKQRKLLERATSDIRPRFCEPFQYRGGHRHRHRGGHHKRGSGSQKLRRYCRNRWRHLTTRERHLSRFVPYLARLGGAYLGIGGEQNLTMMSWAQSRIGWIVTDNPLAYRVWQLQRRLILLSKNRRTYLRRWYAGRFRRRTIRLLRQQIQEPAKVKSEVKLYRRVRRRVQRMYRLGLRRHRKYRYFQHWLRRDASYQYIRAMFQTKRLNILYSDLANITAVQAIAKSLRRLKLPLRIFYLSHYEDLYKKSPASFLKGLSSLPMDERSLILRTHRSRRYGRLLSGGHIYVVQEGLHAQELLKKERYRSFHDVMLHSLWIPKGLFVVKKLPRTGPPL